MIKDREFITKHISDVEPKGNSIDNARKDRASLQSESCRIALESLQSQTFSPYKQSTLFVGHT